MADALSGLATPQELAVIDAALQNFERNSRDLEGLSGLVGVAVAKEIAVSCSRSVDRALGELCEQTYGEADNRDAEFLTLRRRIHEDLT
jgi:cytosine/adenosine deaminase-related metal-dependent hydrolase